MVVAVGVEIGACSVGWDRSQVGNSVVVIVLVPDVVVTVVSYKTVVSTLCPEVYVIVVAVGLGIGAGFIGSDKSQVGNSVVVITFVPNVVVTIVSTNIVVSVLRPDVYVIVVAVGLGVKIGVELVERSQVGNSVTVETIVPDGMAVVIAYIVVVSVLCPEV